MTTDVHSEKFRCTNSIYMDLVVDRCRVAADHHRLKVELDRYCLVVDKDSLAVVVEVDSMAEHHQDSIEVVLGAVDRSLVVRKPPVEVLDQLAVGNI